MVGREEDNGLPGYGRKPRLLLNDRQVQLMLRDIREFGYADLTFREVREIANQVALGEHSTEDPVALIIAQQIDEAVETVREVKGE